MTTAKKAVYGICDAVPMIMFCGFPVMVAVLPTLDDMATASR